MVFRLLSMGPAHGAEISPDLWLRVGGGKGWRSPVVETELAAFATELPKFN